MPGHVAGYCNVLARPGGVGGVGAYGYGVVACVAKGVAGDNDSLACARDVNAVCPGVVNEVSEDAPVIAPDAGQDADAFRVVDVVFNNEAPTAFEADAG